MQVPRAEPGVSCPLWRRDVSKVCHTCAFWKSLPVGRKTEGGTFVDTRDRWSCAFLHQVVVAVELLASVDGLQRATESFRNTAWDESQKNLSDVVVAVREQSAALRGVADSVCRGNRLVDGQSMKLIEGRDS